MVSRARRNRYRRSKFLRLNSYDIIKSLVVSILTGLLNGLYTINMGMSNSDILRHVLLSGISAGAGYLLKNLFTDDTGRLRLRGGNK